MEAVQRIVAAIETWRSEVPGVLVVAIDGPGGSGKTTIARAVAAAIGAAVVHADDFFGAGDGDDPGSFPAPGTNPGFRQRSPRLGQRDPLARYYDHAAIRECALQPLRSGQPATFRRRDWRRPGVLGAPVRIPPRDLILVEGVSASSPALADLVDRTVLVQTPEPVRLQRLHGRITDEEWDEAWLADERRYFAARPAGGFDLAVPGL